MATQTTDQLLRALRKGKTLTDSQLLRFYEDVFPDFAEQIAHARESDASLKPYQDIARDYAISKGLEVAHETKRHTPARDYATTKVKAEAEARPTDLSTMPTVLQQSMASYLPPWDLAATARSSRSIAKVMQPLLEKRIIDAFLDDTDLLRRLRCDLSYDFKPEELKIIRRYVADMAKRPLGELEDSELCIVADDLMEQRGAEDDNYQRILAEDTDKCRKERVGYLVGAGKRLASELKLSPSTTPFRDTIPFSKMDARRPDMCQWFESARQMTSRFARFNKDDEAKRRAVELKRSIEEAAQVAERRVTGGYDLQQYEILSDGTINELV